VKHGSVSSSKVSNHKVVQLNEDRNTRNSFRVFKSRQGNVRRARTYYRLRRGNGPRWDIPNNDIESVSHAVLERVFFTKHSGEFLPAPKPWDSELYPGMDIKARRKLASEHVVAVTKPFIRRVTKLIRRHGKVSPLTIQEFVECYGGAKRKVYESAARSLQNKPLESRDCRVKTFTKDEYRKPDGAPRAIQPRSPRFNVMLGRYIKHLEHDLFKCIDEVFDSTGSHRTVAKGMSLDMRGATIHSMWSSFNDPVAIGLDASRFDQHINTELLKLEFSLYDEFSTGSNDGMPDLKWLLSKQLLNQGRYYGPDGKIKYQVEGNRMSGDMNTSLGNVIIMCTLMYSYLKETGLNGKAKLLNDGDDCVLIMDRSNLDKFRKGVTQWFRKVGITMKIEGVFTQLERIEFCQSRPVFVKGQYRLVPRPSKRLYSDLVSTKPLNSRKVYNKWVGAVAGCGLAGGSGVPVFQAFYSWMATAATPWIPEEGSMYYRYRDSQVTNMEGKKSEVDWATRVSFYHAFNITPSEQLELESYYSSLTPPRWCSPKEEDTILQLDALQWYCPPEQSS
jgi:hypothetical protein